MKDEDNLLWHINATEKELSKYYSPSANAMNRISHIQVKVKELLEELEHQCKQTMNFGDEILQYKKKKQNIIYEIKLKKYRDEIRELKISNEFFIGCNEALERDKTYLYEEIEELKKRLKQGKIKFEFKADDFPDIKGVKEK